MKRLLIALLLLLAAPAWAQQGWIPDNLGQDYTLDIKHYFIDSSVQLARMSGPILGSGGSAALSCTGSVQQSETGTNGAVGLGCSAGTVYYASQFTYSGDTGSVCRLIVTTCKVASPDGTISWQIRTDSGSNVPSDTIISDCGSSTVVDADTCYTFTNGSRTLSCSPGTLTNGTKYWIVAKYNGTVDEVNCARWSYDSDCATELTKSSSNGSSWNSEYSDRCCNFSVSILE